MKNIKQQLAYLQKNKEAILGLTIMLALLLSALALIEIIIDKTL